MNSALTRHSKNQYDLETRSTGSLKWNCNLESKRSNFLMAYDEAKPICRQKIKNLINKDIQNYECKKIPLNQKNKYKVPNFKGKRKKS